MRPSWLSTIFTILLVLVFGLVSYQGYAQRLPREETLYVAISKPGMGLGPSNFNIYTPGFDRSRTGLHQFVWEYLYYMNLESGEYIPFLAESQPQYSADFRSITVKLRDGIKWNDGMPFTADDVVFTYNMLLQNAPKLTWSSEVAKWMASVRKIDDLTVRFVLKSPNSRLHTNREAFPAVAIWGGITIMPKHIWEHVDPVTYNNSPVVGTGPYNLISTSETQFVLERRDDWWATDVFGVVPAPRFVVYRYFGPETSTAIALANNDVDSPAIGILSLDTYLQVKRRNPYVTAWHERAPFAWLDPCPRAFMVQNAREPFNRREVRWGLSYLIDRDAIADLAYQGTTTASPHVYPLYAGLQPFFDAIQDVLEKYPTTEYNPAKAEEMFRAAGFRKGADGGWITDTGQRFTLNFLVASGNSEDMAVTAIVADQLRAGGVDVTVNPMSGPPQADTRLRGDWDLAYQPFCPGFIFDNLELFHSKFKVPLGDPAPWYERNSFRYGNPEFDTIVDEMAATPPTDVDKMTRLFHDAIEILHHDLPVIMGMQAPALVPFSTAYWTGWPTAANPWNMPVNWWATFNTVVVGYPDPATGEWVGGIRPSRPGG
ncbi:MAG: ABC transporter substrate-binding protein [Candidatus Bipolaricaulia bacterium]